MMAAPPLYTLLRPLHADMRHVPEAVSLYDQLGVKKAPLSLIPPAFETPLPPLEPATFPPVLREPQPPALELFDLDEAFAGEQVSVCTVQTSHDVDCVSVCVPGASCCRPGHAYRPGPYA